MLEPSVAAERRLAPASSQEYDAIRQAAHVTPQTIWTQMAIHSSPMEITGMVDQGYCPAWE